jgi:RecA/RadA recombinase
MAFYSGNKEFDSFLKGGYKKGLNVIYGPFGSGKTLFCLLASLITAKKTIYIDTRNGFSTERAKQIIEDEDILENILLLRPKSFYKQKVTIESLKENVNESVGLIVVDSITHFYRLEMAKKEVDMINRVLAMQLNILEDIAEKNNIPILITAEIYDDMQQKGNVKILGGEIIKRRSKLLIELKKYKTYRKALLKKPLSPDEFLFKIEKKGITNVTPH